MYGWCVSVTADSNLSAEDHDCSYVSSEEIAILDGANNDRIGSELEELSSICLLGVANQKMLDQACTKRWAKHRTDEASETMPAMYCALV